MNSEYQELLFKIACKAIEHAVNNKYEPPKNFPRSLKQKKGVFVTLTIDNRLRGCIGSIKSEKPLAIAVYDNAINSAINDPRFQPLLNNELSHLYIEISILSEPKEIKYKDINDLLNKIQPHKYGLIIYYNHYEATFLPQVWKKLEKKQDFLSQLCLKAGLDYDFWKTGKLRIEYYTNELIIGPRKFETISM